MVFFYKFRCSLLVFLVIFFRANKIRGFQSCCFKLDLSSLLGYYLKFLYFFSFQSFEIVQQWFVKWGA